jgi:hypothetical protein
VLSHVARCTGDARRVPRRNLPPGNVCQGARKLAGRRWRYCGGGWQGDVNCSSHGMCTHASLQGWRQRWFPPSGTHPEGFAACWVFLQWIMADVRQLLPRRIIALFAVKHDNGLAANSPAAPPDILRFFGRQASVYGERGEQRSNKSIQVARHLLGRCIAIKYCEQRT